MHISTRIYKFKTKSSCTICVTGKIAIINILRIQRYHGKLILDRLINLKDFLACRRFLRSWRHP